ncbi:MAG: hypothetical protein WC679_04125 [Bacteroidales bacterium]|jgi:hypothetical protein
MNIYIRYLFSLLLIVFLPTNSCFANNSPFNNNGKNNLDFCKIKYALITEQLLKEKNYKDIPLLSITKSPFNVDWFKDKCIT